MADTSPKADLTTVFSTLRFLHKTKRVHQFRLKNAITARKYHEGIEAEERESIHRLNLRIQRELDAHPELANGIDWD